MSPCSAAARRQELQANGVRVLSGVSAVGIEQSRVETRSRLCAADSVGGRHDADLVIFAVGVRSNSGLVERAGAKLGTNGAVAITRHMRANLTDVFAAGDCVETYHRLLDRQTYLSLGTIAHKQGRIAGENAVGGDRQFAGAVGTQSLKVFDLAIARTGLLTTRAAPRRLRPPQRADRSGRPQACYPGAVLLHVVMTGDRSTGRLLGAHRYCCGGTFSRSFR
jgi:NADPH-dependent 2,4-dienoyl-CoA reductase/sulfur reductase-like enzyme